MRCYGLTKYGRRCKRSSNTCTSHYGISLSTCKDHSVPHNNLIYNWSFVKNSAEIPSKIKKFLNLYKNVLITFEEVDPWLAVYASSEMFDELDVDTDGTCILRKFFFKIFKIIPEGSCPICMCNDSRMFIKTRCGHIFCRDCIVKWSIKNFSCPICREIISCPKLK